jgi:hypothetical protein
MNFFVNFGNRVPGIQRWLGTDDAGSSDPFYLLFATFVIHVPICWIHITTYGKMNYPSKTPCRDGTNGDRGSHAIFELLDFITRLAVLVTKPTTKPPPELHGCTHQQKFAGRVN